MWKDLKKSWKVAFDLAWEAYRRNTIPIGAVIVDENENIIAKGRNRIFDKVSTHPLAGTSMAHAEMSAMMKLKREEHPNIKNYLLYTTMEPCPMCFSTMVMMGIRNLNYAAKDGYAGATELSDKMEYIEKKNLRINKAEEELEIFQICLQTSREYSRGYKNAEGVLNSWK